MTDDEAAELPDNEDAAAALAADLEIPRRRRGRRALRWVGLLLLALAVPMTFTYVQELRKPGFQSVEARTAEWARSWRLGPLVDWAEQRRYSKDQFAVGGTPSPDLLIIPITTTTAVTPTTTTALGVQTTTTTTTTVPQRPHLTPPKSMPTIAVEPAPFEGLFIPRGPLIDGFHGVYTTGVRPDDIHTSLFVFVAWIDPLLTKVELFPGTDLPGGSWKQPSKIPKDRCASAIFAGNGGFRLSQSRGGYYAEGKEKKALRDGAASLVIYKDDSVDVLAWGDGVTAADLPNISSVRQNLELLVIDGKPAPYLDRTNWGALLSNATYVWRSAWGITADGALLYVGGPALSVDNLVRILIDAGAVRAMEGDINPEWVSGNLYAVDENGNCVGYKGLEGTIAQGGMRAPGRRYLSADTRDFVAVFADPGRWSPPSGTESTTTSTTPDSGSGETAAADRSGP